MRFNCCECKKPQEVAYSTYNKYVQVQSQQLAPPVIDAGRLYCPMCLVEQTATAGRQRGKKCLRYNLYFFKRAAAPPAKFKQQPLDGTGGTVEGRVGEPAWEEAKKWFLDDAFVTKLEESGAMAVIQREGDTFYLPPGYGHFVTSIAGEEYPTSKSRTSDPDQRRMCISIPVWHTPPAARLELLAALPVTNHGEHSEAQMTQVEWGSAEGRKAAAAKILEEGGTSVQDFIHDPYTPALVSVGSKPGQGCCSKITKKMLASISIKHHGDVWIVGMPPPPLPLLHPLSLFDFITLYFITHSSPFPFALLFPANGWWWWWWQW
jgi:hypothetical protein